MPGSGGGTQFAVPNCLLLNPNCLLLKTSSAVLDECTEGTGSTDALASTWRVRTHGRRVQAIAQRVKTCVTYM